MPSPLYRSRKPRPLITGILPAAVTAASAPVATAVIAGPVGNTGDPMVLIVLFSSALTGVDPADGVIRVFDTTNSGADTLEWGFVTDPTADITAKPLGFWITYTAQNARADYVIYQPAGKPVGSTDATGIPIQVKMFVRANTLYPLQSIDPG